MIHLCLHKLWFDSTSQRILVKHLLGASGSLKRIKLTKLNSDFWLQGA